VGKNCQSLEKKTKGKSQEKEPNANTMVKEKKGKKGGQESSTAEKPMP